MFSPDLENRVSGYKVGDEADVAASSLAAMSASEDKHRNSLMTENDRILLNSLPLAKAIEIYPKLQLAGIYRSYEERLAAKGLKP